MSRSQQTLRLTLLLGGLALILALVLGPGDSVPAGDDPSPVAPPRPGGGMLADKEPAPPPGDEEPRTLTRSIEFAEGERTLRCWIDPSYLLEYAPDAAGRRAIFQISPDAQDLGTGNGVRTWRLSEDDHAADVEAWLRDRYSDLAISLVYRDGPTTDAPVRYLPGGVIVEFPAGWSGTHIQAWATERQLTIDGRVNELSNMYRVGSPPGQPSLDLAAEIQASGDVAWAIPVWVMSIEPQ